MSKQIDRPEGQPTQEPIFVPKQDNQVALDLDECLDLIYQEQKAKKVVEDRINNLKAVAKEHLKRRGVESYESPVGRKASWSERQQPSYDRELIQEKLPEAIDFKTVKSFTVR